MGEAMDHLAEARIWAGYAEAQASSPDQRSIPSQLAGILHALTSIAESLDRLTTTTPATEPAGLPDEGTRA